MNSKTKSVGIVGAVILAGAGASMLVNKEKKEPAKPGYELVEQSGGKYTVFTVKDGKKTKMGDDLTPEQADNFRDKKIGRHKKE